MFIISVAAPSYARCDSEYLGKAEWGVHVVANLAKGVVEKEAKKTIIDYSRGY